MRRYLIFVVFLVMVVLISGCSIVESIVTIFKRGVGGEYELKMEPFEPFRLTENMVLIAGGPSNELVVMDTEKDEVVRRIKFVVGPDNRFRVVHGKVYMNCEGTPVMASRTVFVIYPEEGVGRSIRVSEDEVHSVNVGYDKVIDRVVVFHDWGRLSIVDPNTDKFERKVELEGSPYIFDIKESEVGIYGGEPFTDMPVYVLDLRNNTYKVITTNDVNQGITNSLFVGVFCMLMVSTNELWYVPSSVVGGVAFTITNLVRVYSYPDIVLKRDIELVWEGKSIYPVVVEWYKESNWVIFISSEDGSWWEDAKAGIGVMDISSNCLINYVSPSWFSNSPGSGIRISNGKLYLFYSNKFHVFSLPSLEKIREIKVW